MTEFEGHAQGAWAATRTESMARSFFEVRESQREVSADYIQSGEFTLQTRDDNDHTFHGIVFNVELTGGVPIEWLEVSGVSVRGALGEVKVLTADGGFEPDSALDDRPEMRRYFSPLKPPKEWKLRFAGDVPPAPREPRELLFAKAARLVPGRGRGGSREGDRLGVYVHAESSDGVVYNNQRHRGVTHEDAHVRILSGIAHTGGAPFARVGYWGDVAWRPRREFVGSVKYEVRLLLWTPDAHGRFTPAFRKLVRTFLLCRAAHVLGGGATLGLGHLPLEALYYVLAFARHDWPKEEPPPPGLDDEAETEADDEEQWEVRRDAYGSRVLVPRSQCTSDDTEDDDVDDEDDDIDDFMDDDDDDYDDDYDGLDGLDDEEDDDDDDDDLDDDPDADLDAVPDQAVLAEPPTPPPDA